MNFISYSLTELMENVIVRDTVWKIKTIFEKFSNSQPYIWCYFEINQKFIHIFYIKASRTWIISLCNKLHVLVYIKI